MRCDPAHDQNFVKVVLIKGQYGSFLNFLTSEVAHEIHIAKKQKVTDLACLYWYRNAFSCKTHLNFWSLKPVLVLPRLFFPYCGLHLQKVDKKLCAFAGSNSSPPLLKKRPQIPHCPGTSDGQMPGVCKGGCWSSKLIGTLYWKKEKLPLHKFVVYDVI